MIPINQQAQIRENLLNFIRAFVKEKIKQGPSRIEIDFFEDYINIYFYDFLSKFEKSIVSMNDPETNKLIIQLRQNVVSLLREDVEKEVSKILNMEVVVLGPFINESVDKAVFKIVSKKV